MPLEKTVRGLIKSYSINIRNIINNSDNEFSDIVNESYIVYIENKNEIDADRNVFINKLRSKCLTFNKYGKRIESKKDWERFNGYEDNMNYNFSLPETEDFYSDFIYEIVKYISEEEYSFIIDYYGYGGKECSKMYNMSYSNTRKRASNIINKIKKHIDKSINGG